MKILIPGQRNTMDGTGTYVLSLVEVLKKRGHTVSNIILKENSIIKILKQLSSRKIRGYDLIFSFYNNEYNTDCPVLYHNHAAVISNLALDLYKINQNKGHHISMNSYYQFKQMTDYGLSPNKLHVLPNCVDEQFFKPFGRKKKKNSIILLGRMSPNNGNTIVKAIKAMKYLPDYNLDLVGTTEHPFRERLGEIIKENNIKNVEFKKACRNKFEVRHKINEYEIGIGVGRAMMEMILCGLPVLLFGQGYAGWIDRDVIDNVAFANYTTRLFPRFSEEEVVRNIIKDIRKPRILDRYDAIKRFGLYSNIHIYEKLFGELK
ncbi:MAG: hypothetical protein ACW96U_01015 [Candidatus Heimdallarchaeaceae archaeon]|jgi:glycosyltransferase involved in cell wall biosynthesis